MTSRWVRGLRRTAFGIAGQLLVSLPAEAAPSAGEKAAAEALFQEGTQLMQAQDYAAACPKFEASNAIEPGLGTKLWLADCYDRAGRTASAWALFSEAAALAQQAAQTDREKAARERAQDLEQRLSKLELKLPAEGLPASLEVTLNGARIHEASLGSALPVDPGPQKVVLRANGYRTRTLETEVPVGPITVAVDVPQLEAEPQAARREPAKPTQSPAQPAQAQPGGTQRTLGYAVGGLGLLAFAGSGFLAYRAHSLDSDSRTHCLASEPNACSAEGTRLREQARNFGNVATGAVIAGAALTATGVVLLFTAPSGEETVRVGTRFAPGGAGLFVSGTL